MIPFNSFSLMPVCPQRSPCYSALECGTLGCSQPRFRWIHLRRTIGPFHGSEYWGAASPGTALKISLIKGSALPLLLVLIRGRKPPHILRIPEEYLIRDACTICPAPGDIYACAGGVRAIWKLEQ